MHYWYGKNDHTILSESFIDYGILHESRPMIARGRDAPYPACIIYCSALRVCGEAVRTQYADSLSASELEVILVAYFITHLMIIFVVTTAQSRSNTTLSAMVMNRLLYK